MIQFKFDLFGLGIIKPTADQWSIGDPAPQLGYIHNLLQVTATGDELMMIENKFINLRRVKGSQTTRWFGDDAKFIYANLVEQ